MNKCVLIILALVSHIAYAEIYKCTDSNGMVSYQENACENSSNAAIISDVPKGSRWNEGDQIKVAREVIEECYNGYRFESLDPTEAKMIAYGASVVPAGYPVLFISAVFRNKFGGPEKRVLWCKLTDDLRLDKDTMKKRWEDARNKEILR